MKKAVILQSNYIPWKGYFDLIHDAEVFIFYDEVKYTKNDWRNRNKIYTSNGLQWLTIPIPKDAVKLKISEVKIEDQSWQQLHYKSLYFSYKKSPFFHQLEPLLDEIYVQKKWDSLSELNIYLIKKISLLVGLKTEFINSSDFNLEGDRVERLVSLIKQLGAGEYITGPAAKDYFGEGEKLFEENNIKLTYKNYPDYPAYKQLCEPFRQDVSILDMIANIKLDEIKNYIWNIQN